MPTYKQQFETKMNSLADSINAKAGSTGKKDLDELKTAVDGIQVGTDTSDATISSGGQLLDGVTAYGASGKVTGTIPTKTSSDLTASGKTVTVPAGYYASQATKDVATGSATTPATSITANPSISVNSSTGVITASVNKSQSVTPSVSAGYVASGTAGTVSVNGNATENLTTQAAQTITPTTTDQTIAAGKYLTGAQTIEGVVCTNLLAGIIKDGEVVKIGTATDDDSVVSVTGTYTGGGGSDTPYYLTFSSAEPFTLAIANSTKNWDGTLYYSTDKTTWSTWDGTTTLSSGTDNKIYLCGLGNTVITGNLASPGGSFVITGTNVSCSGNIQNLLDFKTVLLGGEPTMSEYCFRNLFNGCTSLISAPSLPATTLAANCYRGMFYNCTSLTTAPSLPATTLADYCYNYMFSGCTSLTTAPALPATTLDTFCYQNMFNGCTSLTTAPALPVTTLATYCYASMFNGCTSLTTAPALPATTLTTYCYQSMFYNCTSLTTAPVLPATTLAGSCYQFMFSGCTSITTAPALPATTLAGNCYSSMFNGCTSLTTAPALPATTLATSCYNKMFYNCTSLTTAPALPATTLDTFCYQNMFNGCTSIKISTTQSSTYTTAYRIPTAGTGTDSISALTDMFANTGGTFTGTPTINTTYYTSNTIVS